MHKLLCPEGDRPRAEATCFSLLITQLHVHYAGITITYIITSPFLHPIHLRTSHLGFHISTVCSPKIRLSLRELPANSPANSLPSQPRAPLSGNPQRRGPISGPGSSAPVRMSNAPHTPYLYKQHTIKGANHNPVRHIYTNPSNATLPPQHKRALNKEQFEGNTLTTS